MCKVAVINFTQSGVNGFLDVARKTYKEATDDLYQLIQELNGRNHGHH